MTRVVACIPKISFFFLVVYLYVPFPFTILNLWQASCADGSCPVSSFFFCSTPHKIPLHPPPPGASYPCLCPQKQMHYFCFSSLCFALHSNNKFISSPVNNGFHHNKIRICQSKVFHFISSSEFRFRVSSKIVSNNFGLPSWVQNVRGCGSFFLRLFTIGLSEICLWISITLKWIFSNVAEQPNMPIIYWLDRH